MCSHFWVGFEKKAMQPESHEESIAYRARKKSPTKEGLKAMGGGSMLGGLAGAIALKRKGVLGGAAAGGAAAGIGGYYHTKKKNEEIQKIRDKHGVQR